MPTPNKGPRMGGSPAHERLMLANLATSLFEHGRITTTESKAKRLRPYAEHLITFGKRGDLHARRQVLKRLNDKSVVHTLFAEIGPRYVDRPGGYTRITKIGPRKGDNAPMAVIELVEAVTGSQSVVREAERARGTQTAAAAPVDRCHRGVGGRPRRREPDRGRCRRDRPAGGGRARRRHGRAGRRAGGDRAGDRRRGHGRRGHGRPGRGRRAGGRLRPARRGRHAVLTAPDEPALPLGEGGLARVRLDLAYDGTAFAGWAAQRDLRTVQGVLEAALGTLTRTDPPRLTVAGRTDAGVHARGQVAHVDLPPAVAEDRLLLRRLNGLLPPDVRVHRAAAAPPGFDARFSATWRRYRYRVADAPGLVDPLRRADTLAWPRALDLAAVRAASAGLVGEHDFAAYCRRREGATTVRALLDLGWERAGDGVLEMTVRADAFCHSMVRSLVGALLAVGEGRRPADWPAGLLARTERATDVAVAPPHGLCLEAVGYPPDDQLAARQQITRALRVPGPVAARP